MAKPVLVHLGAGIGNVVLATPLLVALHEMHFAVDVWLAADYRETADLLRPWSAVREVFAGAATAPSFSRYAHVLPAIPPFYWPRFAHRLCGLGNLIPRPSDRAFYQDEQQFYLAFAQALGYPPERRPCCSLPVGASDAFGVTEQTLLLAPGCKTGEMATKRWPYFPELAQCFEDVAVVGTLDDLKQHDGTPMRFGAHVRSWVDRLTLRQTAELLASGGAVLGNDSGLSHVAAAVGSPTVMIFGPTPDRSLGAFPPNVRVLRRGMPCEPCWFQARFHACAQRIDCLRELSVKPVVDALRELAPNLDPASAPSTTA